jgi:competence protein ComEA
MNRSIRRIASVAVAALIALAAAPVFAADAPTGVVNVNTATAEQLAMLPGVGPAVAGRIVEHRQKNGEFKRAEDLLLVKGIGEKSFEKMKSYVATSGSTTLAQAVASPRAKKDATKAQG